MLKFRLERKDGRGSLVGLGLTKRNLELLREGKPITIPGEQLGLPRFDFVIVYGEDEAAIAKEYKMEQFLAGPVPTKLRCPDCGTEAQYEPDKETRRKIIGPGAVACCVGCLAFLCMNEAGKMEVMTQEEIADLDASLRGNMIRLRNDLRREKFGR